MNITIGLSKNDMFDIICAFDAQEVLLRQNARETGFPHMKKMFLEGAEKANKNKCKWIAIRDAMFRY